MTTIFLDSNLEEAKRMWQSPHFRQIDILNHFGISIKPLRARSIKLNWGPFIRYKRLCLPEDGLSKTFIRHIFTYDEETGNCIFNVRVSAKTDAGEKVGYLSGAGYWALEINEKAYQLHNLIWLWKTGVYPPTTDKVIDHCDGNAANNIWDNLALVTPAQNSKNNAMCSTNTSGVNGVGWNKRKQKWIARITVDKKVIFLGESKDMNKMIEARRVANIKYGFSLRHGMEKKQ